MVCDNLFINLNFASLVRFRDFEGTVRKCQVEAWTTANEFAGLVLKQKWLN